MNEVLTYLDVNEISYDIFNHNAVYTVEEAKLFSSDIPGVHCKNLFLRNRSGKTHYLAIFREDREVNLKNLSKDIGSSNLSFASEERLFRYLMLKPGSVSPFGLINDEKNEVIVILDESILESDRVTFHPNINTSTLSLKSEDFVRFLKIQGYDIFYV